MKSTGSSNKGLRSYYLHLSHLHAYDLFDTSTIEADPQDPMLLIRWGRYSNGHFVEEGQVRTNRLVDAGTDAKFGEHIRIELNSSEYQALSNSSLESRYGMLISSVLTSTSGRAGWPCSPC